MRGPDREAHEHQVREALKTLVLALRSDATAEGDWVAEDVETLVERHLSSVAKEETTA